MKMEKVWRRYTMNPRDFVYKKVYCIFGQKCKQTVRTFHKNTFNSQDILWTVQYIDRTFDRRHFIKRHFLKNNDKLPRMRLYSFPHFRRDFRHTHGLPALKNINNNIRHSRISSITSLRLRKSDVGRVRPWNSLK